MLEKKINLFWYKHKKGNGNFGDELNPYIIEKLSDQKVIYCNISFNKENKFISLKDIVRSFYHKRISFVQLIKYISMNFKPPQTLLAIGSILQYSHSKKNTVWGSGIISSETVFSAGDFLAVRGPYTQKRLRELGFNAPETVGDPALLLPLVYHPIVRKLNKLGIIPHHIHYQYLRDNLPNEILVIDLLGDIEEVVNQINSCDLTLSTSLHGIIVSHCYNIPSIWTNFTEVGKRLYGDDVKFRDYFASVNLREYQPLQIVDISDFNIDNTINFIQKNYSFDILPDKDLIKKIQRDLLSVAPFTIKNTIEVK